ncbi:MAG: hypothetical protein DYG89_38230 [Caldilinea sp. CFX5]|nr:hypothetical protein [Caldilinea sp. CFX5]
MNSAFDFATGRWRIGWPGRVARHDLVYLSPPDDPTQGLPLGNGDLGVLVWTEGSKLIFVLNKCDLWDDGPPRLRNWAPEEEDYCSALRHAGRIVLDFGVPLFDLFYLRDFQGRLQLADATLQIAASGPLGEVTVRAFVSHAEGVLCIDVASALPEAIPLAITVERYGSRTFGHWYQQINRDPTIGLAGTQATVNANNALITHQLTSGRFALGCRVTHSAAAPVIATREHTHCAKLRIPAAANHQVALLAAVTSPVAGDAIALVDELLDHSEQQTTPTLYANHAAAWQAFWLRSLLDSGNDYLDNLWHLTMYYANASQRGPSPGRFIHGLWTFSRDVQHWTFYFHWNQQEIYWPLNAAGHHDLITAYLNYRFNALPYGQQDARAVFGVDGAVVSDVTDRRGYNSSGELANHTPVAQIALEFWRQFQYTGDQAFLRERALPYLLEAAKFFASLFVRGDDGLYHARAGTGYEGWIKLYDAITELVCGRVLFATTLAALQEAAVDEPRAAHWRTILAHLAPLPVTEPDDCLVQEGEQWRLKRGHFKGHTAFGNQTFAAGWGIAEGRLLTSKIPSNDPLQVFPDAYSTLHHLEKNQTLYTSLREDMKVYDGIFPFVEYAAVFPSGLVGLAQQGSTAYQLAVNTAKLYAPDCMGWDPLPIVLARLGLRNELAEILHHWPARWQFYCNGFGHYGPRDIQKAEAALRFRTNQVRDTAQPDGPRFPFPMWPFRHMGMESMSVLACALNESLLQSYDGVLRVAPATPTQGQARFTLHAVGGFIVSAAVVDGLPQWVFIESLRGGECRLVNPWPAAYRYCNGEALGYDPAPTLHLATSAGQRWLLTATATDPATWTAEFIDYASNQQAKVCPDGWTQLGLPRMF